MSRSSAGLGVSGAASHVVWETPELTVLIFRATANGTDNGLDGIASAGNQLGPSPPPTPPPPVSPPATDKGNFLCDGAIATAGGSSNGSQGTKGSHAGDVNLCTASGELNS